MRCLRKAMDAERLSRRVRRRWIHHVAHEPLADIARSGAQALRSVDALRIDTFKLDRALVTLPNEPISAVRTGPQMATI